MKDLELVTLHDGRPGRRTIVPVTATAAAGTKGPVLEFIASTDTLDRYDEILEPAGWQLDSYRRNPVFQNAHNYGDIIYTLGRALVTEVREVGGRRALVQQIEFATEVNPMARIAYGLYKGGFLNAVSVGFIPVRWEDGSEKLGYRRKYIEQELLEVSAVAIPANPDALALGLRSGAVKSADLEELADLARKVGGNYWLSLARELGGAMRGK